MRYDYTGNLHTHTVYSDGSATHAELAAAAARAGLDFVITTDHNVWVEGVEGFYDNVLLLVGEEVHDVRRSPQGNHFLAYGVESELALLAGDPQTLIDQVHERGGFGFLAHPWERGTRMGGEALPWYDLAAVDGYTGIELWNYMSEFKGLTSTLLSSVLYAFFPALGIRKPFRQTLRLLDRLLAEGRRVVVIGGADAHAETYHLGPLTRVVHPYEYLFRCVNTHIMTDRPLPKDLATAKALIYEALRSGRTWVGYDLIGATRGFRFRARSGANRAVIGGELVRTGAAILEVETPLPSTIHLLRDGRVVARARGRALKYTSGEPGVYRVEVYRNFRLGRRGWIFTSPIYVV